MNVIPPFTDQQLSSIAKVLGDTENGLTGSEIGRHLSASKIPDTSPGLTKWKRLYNAFAEMQNDRRFGNHVLVFIKRVMSPVSYTSNPGVFDVRRDRLNVILAFSGMTVGDDGAVRWIEKASNIPAALERASRLYGALVTRKVHEDVLRFCKAELLQENYFHAVFEAMKSIAAKIRTLSGLVSDGGDLVTAAFSLGKSCTPLLAINSLKTETEKSEQKGFANLLVGLFGTIRNPAAHAPKIEWEMVEDDALDILTMASLIHRKLDRTKKLVRVS